jgi:hypothetical protein
MVKKEGSGTCVNWGIAPQTWGTKREDAMDRQEFLSQMAWPVLMAAGMVIAGGIGEHVSAGGKRKSSSGGGGSQFQGSSGTGNKSNLGGMDTGSRKFKTNNGPQKEKGLIVYDDLYK